MNFLFTSVQSQELAWFCLWRTDFIRLALVERVFGSSMPPKKRAKLIKGQSFLTFSAGETPESTASSETSRPTTETESESDRDLTSQRTSDGDSTSQN